MVTYERFMEIMEDDDIGGSLLKESGCKVLKGLNLIAKYLPESGIEGADHDEVYACGIEELVEAGITEEDVVKLRCWNWLVRDAEYLAHYV